MLPNTSKENWPPQSQLNIHYRQPSDCVKISVLSKTNTHFTTGNCSCISVGNSTRHSDRKSWFHSWEFITNLNFNEASAHLSAHFVPPNLSNLQHQASEPFKAKKPPNNKTKQNIDPKTTKPLSILGVWDFTC